MVARVERHVRKGIINPSGSNYIIVFLAGTVIGGIAFGVGFSLGQRLIDNLSNRMAMQQQQPPPQSQSQSQQPAQAQQATPTTAFLGEAPKYPWRTKWNQPFWN